MCVKAITAYQDSKGGMYPLETTALIAEAGIITNASLSILQGVFGHADALIPLFQRYSAIQAEKAKAEAPSAEPTTLSASTTLSVAELNAEQHNGSCRARATGKAPDCNCDRHGMLPPTPPTLSAEALYERRAALLGRLQAWSNKGIDECARKAKQFISAGGYDNLSDLNSRATDTDIANMHSELTTLGVA